MWDRKAAGSFPPEAINVSVVRANDEFSLHHRRRTLDRPADTRMAATLARLGVSKGDRVALYGFRSRGRSAVRMVQVKSFSEVTSGLTYERLGALAPADSSVASVGGEKNALPANVLLQVLDDGRLSRFWMMFRRARARNACC